MEECIFCSKPQEDIIAENDLAKAFYDQFPVNEGHVLIVPKRHIEGYFEATFEELDAINKLVFEVKEFLNQTFNPDGYNLGVNIGSSAGQTVFHLHVHLIPRYTGDVEDPRGGIRRFKKSVVPYVAEGEE